MFFGQAWIVGRVGLRQSGTRLYVYPLKIGWQANGIHSGRLSHATWNTEKTLTIQPVAHTIPAKITSQ